MRRGIFVLAVAAALTACVKNLKTDEALSDSYDQSKSIVVNRPFAEIYPDVVVGAKKCLSRAPASQTAMIGNAFVPIPNGVRRDVDEHVRADGKSASIDVVVRGGIWPFPPEVFILKAEIESIAPDRTKITTYNSDPNRIQRAFHSSVQTWAEGNTSNCKGLGFLE